MYNDSSNTIFKNVTATGTREQFILPAQILEGFTKKVIFELRLEKWVENREKGVEKKGDSTQKEQHEQMPKRGVCIPIT